jgi:hypothetical protein
MRAKLILDSLVRENAENLEPRRRFDLGMPPLARRRRPVWPPPEGEAPILSLRARVARVNKGLWQLGQTYHESLPIDTVTSVLEASGFSPPEEGVYSGRDGKTHEELKDSEGKPTGKWLAMSWHRMEETGRYEFVAYVS